MQNMQKAELIISVVIPYGVYHLLTWSNSHYVMLIVVQSLAGLPVLGEDCFRIDPVTDPNDRNFGPLTMDIPCPI